MNVKRRMLISTITSGNILIIPCIIIMFVIPVLLISVIIDAELYNIDGQRVTVSEKKFIGPIQEIKEKQTSSSYEDIIHNYNNIIEKQKIDTQSKDNANILNNVIAYVNPVVVENDDSKYHISIVTPTTFFITVVLLIFMICLPIACAKLIVLRPYRQIIEANNMEKRAKALQKIGIPEFIKSTDAVLIDSSSRGNMLYESMNIINGQRTRFLVYQDISTERMYVKYVPIVDRKTGAILDTADRAQAWSLSMSLQRYERMTIEA